MPTENFNGHSMTGELQRVLVSSPRDAGWEKPERLSVWKCLGFLHEPRVEKAQQQHDDLCRELEAAGAEVIHLRSDALTLDAIYTHDASFPSDFGLICMRLGKACRIPEAAAHRRLLQDLGIPVLGEINPPGKTEAGDMVWLDSHTLLIGHGYRTNAAGIEQMRQLFAVKNVEVLAAPLPHGPGPNACLHLMSLMSLLDEETILVDLPWLSVQTVDLLQARGFKLIEIDYGERDTLACNVLALGRRRLLALDENKNTNQKLRQAGFDVRTFPGSELCINGSGGPTCLTRPLLRS